MYFTFITDWSF